MPSMKKILSRFAPRKAGKLSEEAGKTGKTRLQRIAKAAPDALALTLVGLRESSDACPPLKSVVSSISVIVTLAQV